MINETLEQLKIKPIPKKPQQFQVMIQIPSEGVAPNIWEFFIGGYQPAQKWLKDRKGKILGFEEILHYQKIIVALSETDRLMKEIVKIN